MAWSSTVTLDPDKPDVGYCVAVFTDTDSTTFTYSARVHISVADRDAFIAAAIAARNAWRSRKTSEAGYKTNVDNRFVAMDV